MPGLMDLFTQKVDPNFLWQDVTVDPKMAEQAAMAAMFAAPAGMISPADAMRALAGTKIMDQSGLPQMVYRGASNRRAPFEPSTSRGSKSADIGTWYTSSPDVANTYTGSQGLGHVSPAYLNMKNPLVIDAGGNFWGEIPKSALEQAMGVTASRPTLTSDQIARIAKQRGYEGVQFKNMLDSKLNQFTSSKSEMPSDVFVNFDPQNVYSAISDKRLLDMLGI